MDTDNNGCFVMDRMDGIKKPLYNSTVYDMMNLYLTNPLPLDRICRICLCENRELTSLFDANVYKMLNSFGFIQVSEDDGLPSLMCNQCVLRCSRAYTFKYECERSDSILRKYISPEFQEKLVKHTQSQMKQETEEQMRFSKQIKVEKEDEALTFEFVEYTPELQTSGVIKSDPDERQNIIMSIKQETCTNETITDNLDRPAIPQIPDIATNFTEKYRHQCLTCDASFTFNVDLKAHIMKSHPEERPYVCNVCNTGFTVVEKLKSHMRSHTKKHRCDICSLMFMSKRHLREHKKKHTNNKLPDAEGKCLVCLREFKWANNLFSHKRQYQGHNLFACARCGKQYTQVGYLKSHFQTCDASSKSFTQKFSLQKQSVEHMVDKPEHGQFCGKGWPLLKAGTQKIKECEDRIKN